MNSETTMDFEAAMQERERLWRTNLERMAAKDRLTLTRAEFDEKYQNQVEFGPDKPSVAIKIPTPEERLEKAGFKREIAGFDFDLLCRAFNAVIDIPNMGILLTGPVGCGKTFGLTSMVKAELVRLTDKSGFLSLEPTVYDDGQIAWKQIYEDRNVILDDLGNEPVKSEYGVKVDVVSNFILKWYTDKIENGHKGRLFATTNLTGAQLVERYGDRVTDRLFSMVCVVTMTGSSKRRKPMVIK